MTTPPRKLIRTASQGPYYRYEDAETHRTVLEIHQNRATPYWRVSTPASTSEPLAGTHAAASHANRILSRLGYEWIPAPAP